MVYGRHRQPFGQPGPGQQPRATGGIRPDGPTPSGEVREYCDWLERVLGHASCPASTSQLPRPPGAEDLDQEDAAWTALIAYARAHAHEPHDIDEWDVLLSHIADVQVSGRPEGTGDPVNDAERAEAAGPGDSAETAA